MKIIFNIILIVGLLTAFVPAFRRFLFYLLVGRHFVKEQKQANRKPKEGEIKVDFKPTESKFKGGEYTDYEDVK